ncbi:hypothetical protein [Spiroplasma ixodetis]|uniref:hypothetical protein n=1 Tax=Spiroplasma ixodetis TaxID=2141 RepID=UPI002577FBF4|nr:hypothetical protein [Spiroplasma ixodetis]
MKYKVYTRKIKLDVLNEYVVIKKLKTIDIKTKYQLSTRSLIYNWVKKYQKNNKLTDFSPHVLVGRSPYFK